MYASDFGTTRLDQAFTSKSVYTDTQSPKIDVLSSMLAINRTTRLLSSYAANKQGHTSALGNVGIGHLVRDRPNF